MSLDIASSLDSPVVRVLLVALGAALLYTLVRELRKIPAKLMVLMAAAFLDMVGLLIIIPLLPFYARRLGGDGFDLGPLHLGIGTVVALLVSTFTVAQLLSAPVWGRFSDRFGRRPALLVALGASAIAYVIFGFASSLSLLFISRIVQGAGGGTVGVIQAYVADSVEPEQRARGLGWLSAATNLGVALGPVLGSFAITLGNRVCNLQNGESATLHSIGHAMPGLLAALLCLVNMAFAWRYLRESRQVGEHHAAKPRTSREAVIHVVQHSGEPASRLIWIYAIAMGAFQGVTAVLALFLADRFQVTEQTIGYFFMYIGSISVFARVLLLGKAVDRLGEPRLSRIGVILLAVGLGAMPLARTLPVLALAVAFIPLGTAFLFPCVTALLSRVISPRERGLYMGVQQSFGGVARIIAPLWAGFAYDHLGIGVPFYTSAAVVLATLLLGVGLEHHVRRDTAAAR
ncbi:MAG: major facilitator superfamily 1 [Geminicoccaceae bacterium]|nr:major facilitator superfamily 1 [Geminicoccaceae bacterium]